MTGQLYTVEITLERADGWQDYATATVNVDPDEAIVYGASVFSGEIWRGRPDEWTPAKRTEPNELADLQRRINSGKHDVEIVERVRDLITKKENQL
jgi:hypothetical protein